MGNGIVYKAKSTFEIILGYCRLVVQMSAEMCCIFQVGWYLNDGDVHSWLSLTKGSEVFVQVG